MLSSKFVMKNISQFEQFCLYLQATVIAICFFVEAGAAKQLPRNTGKKTATYYMDGACFADKHRL